MASRPILDQLARDIEARGGDDYIFDKIADGVSIGKIMAEFGRNRRLLYEWRDLVPGRAECWDAAMRLSAEAELEKATYDFDRLDRIIDTDDPAPLRRVPIAAEVQLVTGRAKYRQWLASRKDPERFGEKNTTEVNVSFGALHLEAIQRPREVPVVQGRPVEVPALTAGDQGDGLADLM